MSQVKEKEGEIMLLSKLFPYEVAEKAKNATFGITINVKAQNHSYYFIQVNYNNQQALLEFFRKLGYEESEYLFKIRKEGNDNYSEQ